MQHANMKLSDYCVGISWGIQSNGSLKIKHGIKVGENYVRAQCCMNEKCTFTVAQMASFVFKPFRYYKKKITAHSMLLCYL